VTEITLLFGTPSLTARDGRRLRFPDRRSVTAAFAGSVRLRKLTPNGDVTTRTDPPFSSNKIAGTPLPLVPGVEKSVVFTVPNDAPHGSGTYIVEIDGDGDAAGSYSLSLASP